ncbi:MAG: RNA polymerase sigma factor [Bacteroidota bacterium]
MNHDSVFDALLIERIGNGNKKAANLLVKRWHKRLISFSYKLINNLEVAQDIVQDSWVMIFKNLRKLKDTQKFKTWAFRIVHNRSIDWARKNKSTVDINNADIDQGDSLETEDKSAEIIKILKRLKDKDRIILTLFYLEQNNIYEIAEILGVPAGTVKSRIFYAREDLKKKYKEVYHE